MLTTDDGGASRKSEDVPIGRVTSVGRFSVVFELTNGEDVVAAKLGVLPVERIRRAQLSGVVDTAPHASSCLHGPSPPWACPSRARSRVDRGRPP